MKLHMLIAIGVAVSLSTPISAEVGPLMAWGDDSYGETNVPAGSSFVAVQAGYGITLALDTNGALAFAGDTRYGAHLIPGGQGFRDIGVGYHHSLAITSDGSLIGWGYNNLGQANNSLGPSLPNLPPPPQPKYNNSS